MPVMVGEKDDTLVLMLKPVLEIATPFYPLMHEDMKRARRAGLVRFFRSCTNCHVVM